MLTTAFWIAAAIVAAQPAMPADLAIEYEKGRTAHVTGDAAMLVGTQADGFISIDAGRVSQPTREESLARFRQYFAAVAFRAWDDLSPPIVTLSDDGTMATIAVQKVVRLVPRARADDPQAPVSESRFAWLAVWRKLPEGWRMTTIASTRVPAAS